MLRDHFLLIGGDHIDREPARRGGDAYPPRPIGGLVEGDPQPAAACADALAYLRRMLADPRCEHQAVEAVQAGGQRADLAHGAEYEQLHRSAHTAEHAPQPASLDCFLWL